MEQELDRIAMLARVQKYVHETFGNLPVSHTFDGINFTYFVGSPEDRKFFIKVSAWGSDLLGREKFTLEKYHEVGVPVPKIIQYEEAGFEGGIMTLEHLHHDRDTDYDMRTLGKVLKQMHEAQAPGVGRVVPENHGGKAESWSTFLKKSYVKERSEVEKCIGKSLDEVFGDSLDDFPTYHAVLHCDFGPRNTLWKDGNFRAVIDPQGFVGDPIMDIAMFAFYNGEEKTEELKRGYGQLSRAEEERMRVYGPLIAAEKLCFMLRCVERYEELPHIKIKKQSLEICREKYREKVLAFEK